MTSLHDRIIVLEASAVDPWCRYGMLYGTMVYRARFDGRALDMVWDRMRRADLSVGIPDELARTYIATILEGRRACSLSLRRHSLDPDRILASDRITGARATALGVMRRTLRQGIASWPGAAHARMELLASAPAFEVRADELAERAREEGRALRR